MDIEWIEIKRCELALSHKKKSIPGYQTNEQEKWKKKKIIHLHNKIFFFVKKGKTDFKI